MTVRPLAFLMTTCQTRCPDEIIFGLTMISEAEKRAYKKSPPVVYCSQ
jgi:hypothetical protein